MSFRIGFFSKVCYSSVGTFTPIRPQKSHNIQKCNISWTLSNKAYCTSSTTGSGDLCPFENHVYVTLNAFCFRPVQEFYALSNPSTWPRTQYGVIGWWSLVSPGILVHVSIFRVYLLSAVDLWGVGPFLLMTKRLILNVGSSFTSFWILLQAAPSNLLTLGKYIVPHILGGERTAIENSFQYFTQVQIFNARFRSFWTKLEKPKFDFFLSFDNTVEYSRSLAPFQKSDTNALLSKFSVMPSLDSLFWVLRQLEGLGNDLLFAG